MRSAFQQFRHKSRMQGVAGAIRNKASQNRLADQRKIPEQVENLVTHKLVRKSQRRFVEHSRLRQNDRIFQRSAADQPARLQLLHFMIKPERPRRRDQVGIVRAA